MVDVDEHLRGEVRRPDHVVPERAEVDQRPRASGDGIGDLGTHVVGRRSAHQRAERGVGVERVADAIATRRCDEGIDELVVATAVHVDPLDRAARLAGVEVGAVDQCRHGAFEVGVDAHVGRILATELEPDADEAFRRDSVDQVTDRHRTGEHHVVDALVADHRRDVLVVGVQDPQHTVGQARRGEALGEVLGHQRCLRGVLEHHAVAGEQRRHHRVHRADVRVVPRHQRQHRAHRAATDETAGRVIAARVEVGELTFGDRRHVAGALGEPTGDLGRGEGDRPVSAKRAARRTSARAIISSTKRSTTVMRSVSGLAAQSRGRRRRRRGPRSAGRGISARCRRCRPQA